jgi:hypothetical protein
MPPCLVLAALLLTHDGVHCAPRALDDAALDRITAGAAGANRLPAQGGAAAVGADMRTVSNATVDIDGTAQRGSRAMGVENVADAAVAAGTNASSGATSDRGRNTVTVARQRNVIEQRVEGVARVGELNTAEPTGVETTLRAQVVSLTGRVDGQVLELHEVATGIARDQDSTPDTAIVIGSGFAAAGALQARFDTGSVDFGVSLDASFTITERTCFLFWCSSDTQTVRGAAEVDGHADLPTVSLTMTDGVSCGSVMSTCAVQGGIESQSFDDRVRVIPAGVTGSRGEYLAFAGADLNVDGKAVVRATGNAQEAIRGLNVVNGSRSAVASGVNTAGRAWSSPLLRWEQQNVVIQSR